MSASVKTCPAGALARNETRPRQLVVDMVGGGTIVVPELLGEHAPVALGRKRSEFAAARRALAIEIGGMKRQGPLVDQRCVVARVGQVRGARDADHAGIARRVRTAVMNDDRRDRNAEIDENALQPQCESERCCFFLAAAVHGGERRPGKRNGRECPIDRDGIVAIGERGDNLHGFGSDQPLQPSGREIVASGANDRKQRNGAVEAIALLGRQDRHLLHHRAGTADGDVDAVQPPRRGSVRASPDAAPGAPGSGAG